MTSIRIEAVLDSKDFVEGFEILGKQLSPETSLDDLEFVAHELIRRAIDSPIPSDTRMLANSAAVVKGRAGVTFGFNRRYAFFQDSARRKRPWIIVPRVKRILYIPITTKGRRLHRYGNNPADEGLEFGVDYVLRPRVTIKIKPYGSAIGPNHYFSGTIQKNKRFTFQAISKLTGKRVGRKFKRSSKRLPGGRGRT